jgi:molybdate transport system substrate-binding protein
MDEFEKHNRSVDMARTSVVLMALVVMLSGTVHAAEITVLSGGAVEPGLKAATAVFEKESGHAVKITFNTSPQIAKRVAGGDTFDVVIAPPAAIKEFAKAGKVDDGGVTLGRVGSGVAVRPGAPVPDISSAEAIKRAVLEAESIVFNRASTGIYIEDMLKKMGFTSKSKPRPRAIPTPSP